MAGNVAAVILAAGESRRFGSAKQLATLHGRSLLEHVIARAVEAGLAPAVAGVPVWLTRPATMDDRTAVRWVRNPHPERGMSHSLRLGFAALPPEVEAAVILLGDQPTLRVERIRAVVTARGTRPIVAAHARGRPAPPVLVERSHFAVIDVASGDAGLRSVLAAHPEWVTAVDVEAHPADVDTPDDLAALP